MAHAFASVLLCQDTEQQELIHGMLWPLCATIQCIQYIIIHCNTVLTLLRRGAYYKNPNARRPELRARERHEGTGKRGVLPRQPGRPSASDL